MSPARKQKRHLELSFFLSLSRACLGKPHRGRGRGEEKGDKGVSISPSCAARTASASSRSQGRITTSCLRENGLFWEFSLRLSRACLGKMIIKSGEKSCFLSPPPWQPACLRRLGSAWVRWLGRRFWDRRSTRPNRASRGTCAMPPPPPTTRHRQRWHRSSSRGCGVSFQSARGQTYCPSNLAILLRPVIARTMRQTCSEDSVPELV